MYTQSHIALLLSRTYNWPVEEVTEIWLVAERTAQAKLEGTGADYFPYALTLAQNLLRMNASLSAATWWERLPYDAQVEYLTRHPNSRRRLTRKNGIIQTAVQLRSNKVHAEVSKMGRNFHHSMEGLRSLKARTPVTPRQNKALRKTAKIVGALLLASLVGVALFTPLGGMAADIGQEYLEHLKSRQLPGPKSGADAALEEVSRPESSTSASKVTDPDRASLIEFQQGMTKWLLAQDPVKLAAKIKAYRACN